MFIDNHVNVWKADDNPAWLCLEIEFLLYQREVLLTLINLRVIIIFLVFISPDQFSGKHPVIQCLKMNYNHYFTSWD